MTVTLQQPPPTEPVGRLPTPGGHRLAGVGGVLAGGLGFFSCMPYVALPVSHTVGLQLGSVLSLLLAAPVLMSARRGPLLIPLLLVAPLLISAVKTGLAGEGDLDLCLKTIPVWAVCLMTVAATQFCAPQYSLQLLTGIALATVLHVAVGIYQLHSFASGEFPLTFFYSNPSFLSVQDNADNIARYTQRPFGLFPEPSSMSSSLAPWVLFWIAELCGIVHLKIQPRSWQKFLFGIAAVGGMGLIIISRSGHAAVTLAAGLLFVGLWFSRCKATGNAFAAIIAVFGVAVPVALYFAAEALGDRLGGKSELGNSSWEDRSNSIIFGFNLLANGDLSTILFGIGCGQTSPVLMREARLEAVWSVSLVYLYETGVVGALAFFWVAQALLRVWRKSRFTIVYAAVAMVWLVGVTLTTSYLELLPLWVALGWMAAWPEICSPLPARRTSKASAAEGAGPRNASQSPVQRTPVGWRCAEMNDAVKPAPSAIAGGEGGEK